MAFARWRTVRPCLSLMTALRYAGVMDKRQRSAAIACIRISVVAALIGAVFGMVIVMTGGDTGTDGRLSERLLRSALRGLWTGGFIASLLVTAEFFYINGRAGIWLRNLAFSTYLAARTLLYLVVILAGIWSGATFFETAGTSPFGWNGETMIQLGFSMIFSLAINFALAVNRLLGQAVFWNFLTGRYHRPVMERRVLLFVDLVGSTRTAEAIGDLAFHGLLSDVYRDLTEPVINHGGTIDKYVGDEMITSWRDSPAARRAAIRCGLDFQRVLDDGASRYRDRYGTAPRLRGAIHAGPVVIGEMGDARQEIVYLGDAMNTTARLVDLCRDHDRALLVSSNVLSVEAGVDGETSADAQHPDPDWAVEALGSTPVRGRSQPIPIFAISRQPVTAE